MIRAPGTSRPQNVKDCRERRPLLRIKSTQTQSFSQRPRISHAKLPQPRRLSPRPRIQLSDKMSPNFSMRSLLGLLPIRVLRPSTTAPRTAVLPTPPPPPPPPTLIHRRALSTTPSLHGRVGKKAKPEKGGKKKLDPAAARALARKRKAMAEAKLDPKVAGMMHFLYAPTHIRAPLRMARNRHVRHWTIHRAWQLLRNQREKQHERQLMQMHQSMSNACEALRNLEGPGSRPQGWLFRKAMQKVGVWGAEAVPIEYARPMVETPGERPWNHEWKRA